MRANTPPLQPIKGAATIYPVDIRNALVLAGQKHDTEAIDLITDALARQGLCRARSSDVIQPAYRVAARGLAG